MADKFEVIDQSQPLQFLLKHHFSTHDTPLTDIGLQFYSQTDEDGILLYIFSKIGTTNKVCVEIGCGDGTENNTANLILNHWWRGVLLDAHPKNMERCVEFYGPNKRSRVSPPVVGSLFATAENIDSFLSEQCKVNGNIDLLSIDIDGMDYWVWKAIECIQPRVVVIESSQIMGPTASVTVPYRWDFIIDEDNRDFCGASVSATNKLGREKGYKLVGRSVYGFNTFFVRDDIEFPEISIEQYFEGIEHFYDGWEDRVRSYDWEVV